MRVYIGPSIKFHEAAYRVTTGDHTYTRVPTSLHTGHTCSCSFPPWLLIGCCLFSQGWTLFGLGGVGPPQNDWNSDVLPAFGPSLRIAWSTWKSGRESAMTLKLFLVWPGPLGNRDSLWNTGSLLNVVGGSGPSCLVCCVPPYSLGLGFPN